MRRYSLRFFKWLLISLMCAYFGFMVGKFKQDILYNKIQLLELDAINLNKENNALTQNLSILQANLFSEQQANEALVLENKNINKALDASNKKLYFYERVVAPELSVTGLKVYSFKVKKILNEEAWAYELVLMQDQKRRRLLNGHVNIVFAQADDAGGVSKPVKLSDIDKSFNTAFRFKYFQTLKGKFTLPKKINVDQIFIVAQAPGNRWNRAQRIEKSYNWKDFIENGSVELKELEIQGLNE